MKKIVLTTILLASSLTWAADPGMEEPGGGVNAIGATKCATCSEQEGLPATLTNVDQSPNKKGTIKGAGSSAAPTTPAPAQGNQDKQGE